MSEDFWTHLSKRVNYNFRRVDQKSYHISSGNDLVLTAEIVQNALIAMKRPCLIGEQTIVSVADGQISILSRTGLIKLPVIAHVDLNKLVWFPVDA